jgi:hypothetical protein
MRSGCGWIVLVALAAAAPPAHAEPRWVTDLREKARAYEERLKAALERLKDAAAAAGDALDAAAKARLAELIELLESHHRAAGRLLAEEAERYEAVIYARLDQAIAVTDQLTREVGEVVAGTRAHLGVERQRLVVGTRQIVATSLREAGVMLAETRVIDDQVVADAVRATEAEAKRWLGVVAAAAGVLVIGLGAGLLWQRRRRPASRWLLTGGGAVLIAGGVAAIVLGIRHFRAEPERAPAIVGLTRCDALADAQRWITAGHAPAPDRTEAIAALERCQLLVADSSAAVLVDDRLRRLRAVPE